MVTVLLAGGKSSRFGGDKLAYKLRRVPILRRTFDAARQVDDTILVSVNRVAQTESLRTLLPEGVDFLPDLRYRGLQGPGAGIITGLRVSSKETVLLLAADMPWVEANALRRLRAIARRRRGVAAPLRASGTVEPLVQAHAIAPSRVFLDRLVVRRSWHLRPTDLLRASPRVVLVSERFLTRRSRCFRSVNTRADLRPGRESTAKAAGRAVVPIPLEASRRFWEAASLQMRGKERSAARGFLNEAELYRSLEIPHLELDCLLDAHRCLAGSFPGVTALRRRIVVLRNAIGVPRTQTKVARTRRNIRRSA